MNLKDTLLLPVTNFPMRGNLGNEEPEILQWRVKYLWKRFKT